MSSILTQMALFEKYGVRLSVAELAAELKLGKGTVRNRLSSGSLPIRTYLDGGLRFADFRDVAAYLDDCRSRASAQGEGSPA